MSTFYIPILPIVKKKLITIPFLSYKKHFNLLQEITTACNDSGSIPNRMLTPDTVSIVLIMPESDFLFSKLPIGQFMTWPEITAWAVAGVVLFYSAFILIYYSLKKYYKFKAREEANWHIMLAYVNRHGLITKEITLVKEFFDSLEPDMQSEIILSRNRFRRLLYKYLKDLEAVTAESRVNILEKLFPHREHQMEVHDIQDLQAGETCAIEVDSDHYLGIILKVEADEILLRAEGLSENEISTGTPIGVYVYRPFIGGYLLYGILKSFSEDSLVFSFGGSIEEKGNMHLMAEIIVEIGFAPWPTPPGGPQEKIRGKTVKISDRAIVFGVASREDADFYIGRTDLWIGKLTLPSGFTFSCRGTIAVSDQYEEMYVFKFLDLQEQTRKIIFTEIQSHNPIREKIS